MCYSPWGYKELDMTVTEQQQQQMFHRTQIGKEMFPFGEWYVVTLKI